MAAWQLRADALLPAGNPRTGLPSLPDTAPLGPGKAHTHMKIPRTVSATNHQQCSAATGQRRRACASWVSTPAGAGASGA
eukprot:1890450-Alexandrium_andersonii.AAC.1